MKEGSVGRRRSESDKEKTKMRERQRRAITTNIFHGLRKHGGYPLSPRADINEVLRQLAHEAGWVILPDGTTYRAKVSSGCPLCGAPRETAAATNPTFNGEGKCSTIPSGAPPLSSIKAESSLFWFPESLNGTCHQPMSVPVHTGHELTGEAQSGSIEGGRNSEDSGMTMMTCDLSRSNQKTTMESPPYCLSGRATG